jgi:CRISPR type IV-associated protein Csf2
MSIDAMSAIEVLAAGIHMHAKFDFAEELPEHQVGFGMLCIMDLVNKNQLGGWGRNGFGTYEPNLNVYSDGEDLGPLLKESKRGYEIHEQNASFVDAAEDAVAALSLDGVETFFAARS